MGKSNFYFFDNLRLDIRKRRHIKNWSQKELAERAGVSITTVVCIENGRGCSINSLAAVCDALGIFFKIK